MTRNLVVAGLIAAIMAGFVLAYTALGPSQAQPPMAGMGAAAPTLPPVKGFAEGQEIRFVHTEASDATVAGMLTQMMGSPVLVVPTLAQAPETALATVYVFTNGVKGEGPFGFQPDVFDRPPGDPGYSPLRTVYLVAWKNEAAARLLKSAAEVRDAEAKGEVTVERPGAVVNMPFLTWPGGQR